MPPSIARIWRLHTADADAAHTLQRALGLHPLTAQILARRGLSDLDQAHAFLNPSMDQLHDPLLMRDMKRAVRRTMEAIRDDDPIRVIGDDDVDGVTSASCVYLFLRQLGACIDSFVPRRSPQGGGLTEALVQDAYDEGIRLLITTDCGINAVEPIALARRLGLDVLVIDHHTPPEVLPDATALLNPLLPGCPFPFKRLAAVGVAFNFILALWITLKELGAFQGYAPDLSEYMDLVALGTVADVVPLVDENRVFVYEGLQVLSRRRRPGVSALLERAHVDDQPITARTIGYRIAPLLNAAGRMGDASRCIQLLATDSYRRAVHLARELERDNWERQRHERAILDVAIGKAEAEFEAGRHLLMLSSDSWHQGILGIIASRVKERFHRPTAMVSIDTGTGLARVSMRSIQGINLIDALRNIEHLVESYGGHIAAAGMTLKAEHLTDAQHILEAAIREQTHTIPCPVWHIDAACDLSQLDDAFARDLARLAPFGAEHPEPKLLMRDVRGARTRIVNERHLRLRLRDGDASMDAIGFTLAPLARLLARPVDVLFTPRLSLTWESKRFELLVHDIRRHGAAHVPESDADDDDSVAAPRKTGTG